MNNNKWLVISYFANVKGACQSEWIEDRLLALKRQGIEPVLISSFCGGRYGNLSHIRTFSLSPADIRYELDFALKRNGFHGALFKYARIILFLPLYPVYYLETKVFNVYGESRWSWMPLTILAGLFVALKNKPSIIYSTGGPASAHIIAAVISKITKIPLFSELQDPLVGEDIGRNALSKKGLRYIEKLIFDNARKVVFCTQAAADSAAARHNTDKATCIYPGAFVGARSPSRLDDRKTFRFIYLGSLYQTRNLDRFMEALSSVFVENPGLKDRLCLDVYGNMNEDIRQRIDDFRYNVIKLHGLVPREQAFQMAAQSDVLLLVQNTDNRSSTTIPFKTYDYLLLGRKVLGLTYKNPELEGMLTSHGHMAVPADDAQEIRRAIMALWADWRNGTLAKDIKASELTVEKAAAEMISLSQTIR